MNAVMRVHLNGT